MLKRLALVGGAIAGAFFLRKKAKEQQAEQDLWTQATDDVHATATSVPAGGPTATATDEANLQS